MTKQTVFVSILFVAGQSTGNATISIPFPVKKILVKSAVYDAGTNTATYVCLKSTFGLNAPLGILFRDNTYPAPTFNDVEIELKNPEIIQGNYTFTILQTDGITQAVATVANDYIALIMEFDSE